MTAPRGATDRLVNAIDDDAIVFRVRQDVVEARFGLQPVLNPGRGDPLYPLAVSQGTGLYGRLHRIITPKRAPRMVFPGGGKPWPIRAGQTGLIKRYTVRGQRPQPYMEHGYEVAREYIESQLDDMVDRLVN